MKWQVCPGMGGSFPPEQLAGLLRNHWQVTAGIRIEDDIININSKYQELNLTFELVLKNNPKFKSIIQPTTPSIDEIKSLIDNNTVIVEYALQDKSYSFCSIIHKEKNVILSLKSDFDYSFCIDIYRILLENKITNELADNIIDDNFDKINSLLVQYLIEPIISHINGFKNLIIIPDTILSFIPFESIKINNNRMLIDDYNISYLPSLNLINATKINQKTTKNLLAFGGAVYTDENENIIRDKRKTNGIEIKFNNKIQAQYQSFHNLPESLREVIEIGKIFYQNDELLINKYIITGQDVNKTNIKRMNAEKYLNDFSIIHFATHGIFDIENPDLSSIFLSNPNLIDVDGDDDGSLTLMDIMSFDLSSEIVILSACETALGKIIHGEGVIGLINSFFTAGSKNVIASLWQVNDESTRIFMTELYKLIIKGIDINEAITIVKRNFINGIYSEEYKKQFYWAPFVLYGTYFNN